ncbi:integral membrane protein [Dehalobacter sp. UNSWDHB]|uniref:transglutaminase-like domain-containing protein n=1 Tax=unclassified Dehalobacter TaxID=2635733 RepID=UPI00028A4774|nr:MULTISPECIES: transglutaminase-like domain-containing protein [unclassified Dehalobacter]AFV01523.1 Transglutaminase-like enzyme, putative cysteine protease [Dehalobacter sp. DCA]AFV04557.1 Transglutaminase-like enzyme, putative cysteine protease [Dehalobacter sp. CF]EQB20610.1 integral membrane protein [Dehalobacter sp. UNSWDHB]
MFNADFLTLILIAIFALPILIGAFTEFSRKKIQLSLRSLGDGLAFILVLFLAIYLTRGIFFQHNYGIFTRIYHEIPDQIRVLLAGKDVLIYMVAVPLIASLLSGLIGFITRPVYNAVLSPLANGLYKLLILAGSGLRRIIGALVQLPRAAVMVFISVLLLNFYAYYFPSQPLTRMMNDSGGYQFIYKNAVSPVLNSNLAQKIPVLVNDYFRQNAVSDPTKSKGWVITYFNGVTLDEAVQSDPQIDAVARRVAGDAQNNRQKAYFIYQWITRNITYDEQKAAQLSKDLSGMNSGSVMAFNTRRGVCFDYACLYVSMCRAVDLKVRLVTGLGYSGSSWGDHAWNQVYLPEEDRWANVDATFGTVNNYFDKPDFSVDHRDAEVQGEW